MPPPTLTSPQPIPRSDAPVSDVAIIGAGPVGLFATFYAGMRELSVKLIDSLPHLGGQVASFYPEQELYDVPGFPKASGRLLTDRLVEQAMQAEPTVCLGTQLQAIRHDDHQFHLDTERGTHVSRSVVVAAGIGALTPRRLPMADADKYIGRGLGYELSDSQTLVGRHVVIVGTSDIAVRWAMALSHVARTVTLICRRDTLTAPADVVRQLALKGTVLRWNELAAVHGSHHVESVTLRDTRDDRLTEVRADHVLVNAGFDSSLAFLNQCDLDLSGNGVGVDGTMRTSRAGVYAIGDVCTYPGKLKLIATGFGEAAIAINHVKTWLDPRARLFPGHSTKVAVRRLPTLRRRV
jgi:thioredoxin reductase